MSQHEHMNGFGIPLQEPQRQGGNPLLEGPSIFRISNRTGENRCTGVLLDDRPRVRYRHYIKTPYIPNKKSTRRDMQIRDVRMTCADPSSASPVPQKCKLCEAALRHDDTIKRKFTSNLSLIDQRIVTTKKGNIYHDMKKLLELDYSYHMIFAERMQAAPDSRLGPKQYSIMRPTGEATASRTFGDSWSELRSLIGQDELLRFFWESKAVPGLMEAAAKAGQPIDWATAVQRIIEPIDYDTHIDNYNVELADVFIMLAIGGNLGAEQQQAQQTYHQMGGAPAFPGGSAPAMPPGAVPTQPLAPPPGPAPAFSGVPQGAYAPPAPAMPQQSQVPPGYQQAPGQAYQQPAAPQAPQFAPQAPQLAAPPAYPQQQPQSAYPLNLTPPAAPQSQQQQAPQFAAPAPTAPPMTANPQQQAPQFAPQPQQAPQFAAPVPPAPQAPAQAPQTDYQFAAPPAAAQGWQAQFPGAQAVAPGAVPLAPPAPQAPAQTAPGQVPTGLNPGF